MSQLDDIMTSVGLPALQKYMGDPATYTPAGGSPVSTWAMLGYEPAPFGQYVGITEIHRSAELPAADVPDPQPGDVLVVKGLTYRIDQLISNDGLLVKVAIR